VNASIEGIHKAFENRIKLGIMSALMVNHSLDFNTLKTLFEVSDGNLATHLKALEREHFIEVKKTFVGRKPNTSYQITQKGKTAFEGHLEALEALIKRHK
jgi:DNA-binding HxlR family transcriptional regulator